jgi:hypothetical protein
MYEKNLRHAISLAIILLNTREQFSHALRDAALARMRERTRSAYFNQLIIPRRFLELHVDDALYVIGRDGLDALETNVGSVVDEIIRETLESARGEGKGEGLGS